MKLITSLFILLTLFGCATRTEYGECIGVLATKNPKLQYDLSGQNIVIGIILSETIIVPGIVLFTQLYCPVSEAKK